LHLWDAKEIIPPISRGSRQEKQDHASAPVNRRTFGHEVFVDASAIIAMVDSDDALHQVAQQTAISMEAADALLVLSDAVLSEFLAYCSSPPKLRKSAVAAVDVFMTSPSATVLPGLAKPLPAPSTSTAPARQGVVPRRLFLDPHLSGTRDSACVHP
ncbi:MAG: hypothetical protein ACREJT_09875, partial [Myxococcota bacterium]